MFVQLVCGFLFGISITFLKDAYGSFAGAINFGKFIVAAFIPPIEDISVKSIPVKFVYSAHHFYLQ